MVEVEVWRIGHGHGHGDCGAEGSMDVSSKSETGLKAGFECHRTRIIIGSLVCGSIDCLCLVVGEADLIVVIVVMLQVNGRLWYLTQRKRFFAMKS